MQPLADRVVVQSIEAEQVTSSGIALPDTAAEKPQRGKVLAVGDGALGFWGALRKVFPATKAQRCWVHYAEQRIMPSRDREALWGKGFVLLKSA